MDFKNLKGLKIPEGVIKKITNASNIVLWSVERLPSIYQEVEYVAVEYGVQAYIKLGLVFDTSARIEMGQYIDDDNVCYIFGAAENSGAVRCMLTAPFNKVLALYGAAKGYYSSTQTIGYVNKSLNEYIMTLQKGRLAITNKTNNKSHAATDQIEYTMTNELYLLAQNYNGNPRFGGYRRIHYFKYYDKNGELICDLVPCYRKSDGVIGMYDTVRKIFLTNVGAGSFVRGGVV